MLLAHIGQLFEQVSKGMFGKPERECCKWLSILNVSDLLSCACVPCLAVNGNALDTVEPTLKLGGQRGRIMRQSVLKVCEYHPTEDVHDGLEII